MFDLSKLKKGKSNKPPRVVIYGPHGVGKSFFANGSGCAFIPLEAGLDDIDVNGLAFPLIRTMAEFWDAVDTLIDEHHGLPAVALDTLDWLEKLIFSEICKKSGSQSIAEACGGYGKGYVAAQAMWFEIFDRLEYLRNEKGMMIIMLAHSKVETYNNPMGEDYDRYVLDLHISKSAAIHIPNKVMEYADIVGFCNWKTYTKEAKDGAKQKAIGNGERILYLQERPAFLAKSRRQLPPEMNLDWQEFIAALYPTGE